LIQAGVMRDDELQHRRHLPLVLIAAACCSLIHLGFKGDQNEKTSCLPDLRF
jgi:hypothetical protein